MGLDPNNTWQDSDWFYDILELDLKSTQTTSLDLDWFYDILDVYLKNTLTNLLDSYGFCYNQARILLEKFENLLELSVKQLVIQASSASSIYLSQACLMSEKPSVNVFCSKVGHFSYSASYSSLTLI